MTPTLDHLRARLPEFWQTLGVVDHPVIPLPGADLVHAYLTHPQGRDLLQSKLNERQQLLDDMSRDPLRAGFRLPWWYDALDLLKNHDELLILGGNDSAKSWFGAYWSVKGLIDEPGIDWGFMHETEATSKTQQQSLVHRFLPPEWRDLGKKGSSVNVAFTEQMGFSENRFVLPHPTSGTERGSRGLFFFYKQDPAALTGYKLRGVWCDELITMQALEEIRTRLLGRGGKLLLTFTPKQGYSPPVMDFVAGAQVLQTREARFLPGRNFENRPEVPIGHMPYILQSRRSNAAVLCAFTEWSPFRKAGDLENLLSGKPRAFVKIAAYGWADKTVGNAFPKFSYAVNVIRRNPKHPWNGVGLVPPKPWEARTVPNTELRRGGENQKPL